MNWQAKYFTGYFHKINIKEVFWLGLYFFLLLPPALVYYVMSDLDPSWQLSINLALKNHLVFGKDYIFTFGPLGFLITKQGVFVSKWLILFFELFIISCIVYILRYVLKPTNYRFYLCFIVFLIMYYLAGYSCENLLAPSYLFFLFLFVTEKNTTALALAGILSILSFYMKVNYGLVLILLLYTTLLLTFIKKSITAKQFLLSIALHLTILFLFSFLLRVNLFEYIKSSLSIINSYNDTMYVFMSMQQESFLLAVLVICLYAIGFALCYKYYIAYFFALYFYCLNGLFLYLLFKNGFVRADGHVLGFFANYTAIFGAAYIFTKDKQKKIWGGLTCFVFLISSYFFAKNHLVQKTTDNWQDKLFVNGYFHDIFYDISTKFILTEDLRAKQKVSTAIAQTVGQHSVDIIPWEISEVYYHKMNYCPRPIPQSYCAFNEYLDNKNYQKYVSESAPEYIIYDNRSIDFRHPFWDESITKRALLSHYSLVRNNISIKSLAFDEQFYLQKYPDIKACVETGYFKSGYEHYSNFGRREGRQMNPFESDEVYLLFKKREQPLKEILVKEKEFTMELGKEYKLDITDNFQYLYADIQYSLVGKIKRLLFQPPPIYITTYFEDGTSLRFSAIVPILKTGVLINKKADTRYDSLLLFLNNGKENKNIVKIKFEPEVGFNKEIKVVLKEIRFE